MASFASEFLIAQLRQRGELAAAHVVRRNHAAFDSLSDADRRRVEGLAYTVAARVLEGPITRLERLGQDHVDGATVDAARELFGLDDGCSAGQVGACLPEGRAQGGG